MEIRRMGSAHAVVLSYLDQVEEQLRHISPRRSRDFLLELRTHIETLADEFRDQGLSDTDAKIAACEKIGEPVSLGRAYAAEWKKAHPPETFWRAFPGAGLIYLGFIVLGLACLNLLAVKPNYGLFATAALFAGIGLLTGSTIGALFPKQSLRVLMALVVAHFFVVLPLWQLCVGSASFTYGLFAAHPPWEAIAVFVMNIGPAALVVLLPALMVALMTARFRNRGLARS